MAIAFLSQANVAANNVTETLNTGSPADGTLMLVLIDGISDTVTTPTGWTKLIDANAGNGSAKLYLFWRIAASEPASYNWIFSAASFLHLLSAVNYSGGATRIVASGAGNNGGDSANANVTATGLTADADNEFLICAVSGSGASDPTYTAPTGMTKENDFTSAGSLRGFSTADVGVNTGATGNKVFTQSVVYSTFTTRGGYISAIIAAPLVGGGILGETFGPVGTISPNLGARQAIKRASYY